MSKLEALGNLLILTQNLLAVKIWKGGIIWFTLDFPNAPTYVQQH